MATDRLRYFRAKQAAKLADKLEEKNRLRRSEGRRTIPLRVAIPALENASLDERDEMLDLWAELLANFEDPDSEVEPEGMFVSLLSGMQPIDVAILRALVSSAGDGGAKAAPQSTLEGISTDRDAILRSLHNLARLGCFMAASDAAIYQPVDKIGRRAQRHKILPAKLLHDAIFRVTRDAAAFCQRAAMAEKTRRTPIPACPPSPCQG